MCLYPITIPVKRKGEECWQPTTVACGKCVECLQQKSTEWSFRIMDEAKQYNKNCFLTLTYNDDNLPYTFSEFEILPHYPTLLKSDLQKFMKRLRKHIYPQKVRFFACGEYGSKGQRPHYHVILFGWCPDDLQYFQKDKKGSILYRSAMIEKLWKFGFSSIGELTVDSAKYCAKYMQKLNVLPLHVVKPFVVMSNRPGIGFSSINPKSLTSDRIYHNGKGIKVPRYYLKVLERNGHDLTAFVERRCLVGQLKENPLLLEQRRKKSKEIYKNTLTL